MKFKCFSCWSKPRPRSSVDRARNRGWNSCGFSWIIPTTARGPRCGMKYHPVWITSAETFVRCYRRSLIPPNYKSRRSSVGRYLPLTFSLLPLHIFRLCPPLSLKKTMLLALRSVTVTREEETIKRRAWPGGPANFLNTFEVPRRDDKLDGTLVRYLSPSAPSHRALFFYTD